MSAAQRAAAAGARVVEARGHGAHRGAVPRVEPAPDAAPVRFPLCSCSTWNDDEAPRGSSWRWPGDQGGATAAWPGYGGFDPEKGAGQRSDRALPPRGCVERVIALAAVPRWLVARRGRQSQSRAGPHNWVACRRFRPCFTWNPWSPDLTGSVPPQWHRVEVSGPGDVPRTVGPDERPETATFPAQGRPHPSRQRRRGSPTSDAQDGCRLGRSAQRLVTGSPGVLR